MLMKVVGSVPGYAELLESAKQQSLAAIPPGATLSGHRSLPALELLTPALFPLFPQRSTTGREWRRSKTGQRMRQ